MGFSFKAVACALLFGGLATLWIICFLNWWAGRDFKLIQKTWGTHVLNKKWHNQRLALKILTVLPAPLLLMHFSSLPATLIRFVAFVPYAIALWWTVFDIKLNKLRGLSIFYVGETAGTDMFLRSIKKHTGWSLQYTHNRVKLPLLIGSAVLLLLGYYFTF